METENDTQLKEIIALEDSSFSLADIESIVMDDGLKKSYEEKYHGLLYSKILLLLTHESYDDDEAELLWNKILNHLGGLNHTLGRNVGISVATIDYLSNIKNKLTHPVIIEEAKSEFVSKTSTKDKLTGLYLRSAFDIVLKQNIAETNRENTSLCLLMIDIDDFKTVNDTYGHQEGDNVLKKIGKTINNFVRKMDLPARYGGEEFAIIMPKADMKEALNAAERIRKKIAQLEFKGFSVTISIGISLASRNFNTSEKLIHAADTALYAAKDKGKNCVVSASKLI